MKNWVVWSEEHGVLVVKPGALEQLFATVAISG